MRPKHRSWLRNRERAMDRAFPSAICWEWTKVFDDLPGLCSTLEDVASQTYQRGLGAGFHNSVETRGRLGVFAERGQLRAQLLRVNGDVRAFWLGTVYHDTFYSWATAYDPALRDYEPGNLLFHRLVDELSREKIRTLDFGLGDAFYKRRFGDSSWREATLRIFAPSPKGTLLRTNAALGESLDAIGRDFLKLTGLSSQIKSWWRQRLAPRPSLP
jgi:hypothetical protein